MERIVVGIDGSDGSRRALEWAIAEARLRGAAVEVVMTWHEPYVAGAPVLAGTARQDLEAVERAHRSEMDRVLDSTDTRGLDAPVERILVQGRAAGVLVDVARGADLLVVGSRGRGGFTGLLLGSVSQQVAAHAPCPVVIVPSASS